MSFPSFRPDELIVRVLDESGGAAAVRVTAASLKTGRSKTGSGRHTATYSTQLQLHAHYEMMGQLGGF